MMDNTHIIVWQYGTSGSGMGPLCSFISSKVVHEIDKLDNTHIVRNMAVL